MRRQVNYEINHNKTRCWNAYASIVGFFLVAVYELDENYLCKTLPLRLIQLPIPLKNLLPNSIAPRSPPPEAQPQLLRQRPFVHLAILPTSSRG